MLFCQQRWKLPWSSLPRLISQSLNLLLWIPALLPSPCNLPTGGKTHQRTGAAPAWGSPFPRESPARELQVVSSPWSLASMGAWRHTIPLLPAPSAHPAPIWLQGVTSRRVLFADFSLVQPFPFSICQWFCPQSLALHYHTPTALLRLSHSIIKMWRKQHQQMFSSLRRCLSHISSPVSSNLLSY